MVKFADDLTLIVPARNVDKRSTELQHVQSWSSANNLQLNCKKSQEIVFRRPRSRQFQDIPEFPDVPRVSSIKLLGVTLTENFSMEEHITDTISSSSRALYALRVLRAHGMNDADLQTVFKSTALSKLLYASPSWWGFHQCQPTRTFGRVISEKQSRQASIVLILRPSQNCVRWLMMAYSIE